MLQLPAYFNCFFDHNSEQNISATYKIVESNRPDSVCQLFRWQPGDSANWQNVSICISIYDCLKALLKELVSEDLAAEIFHGQAIMNPRMLLTKLEEGERLISIHGTSVYTTSTSTSSFDVLFDHLVQRT